MQETRLMDEVEKLQADIEALCRERGFILMGGSLSEGVWGECVLIRKGGETDSWLIKRYGRNLYAFDWERDPG